MERGRVREEDFIVLKDYIRRRYTPLLRHFRGRNAYLNTFPEINRQFLKSPYFGKFSKILHLSILFGIYPVIYPVVKPLYDRYVSGYRQD